MGCAVGDVDGDGYPDLLLTGYRKLALLRNERGQRFDQRLVPVVPFPPGPLGEPQRADLPR